MSFVRPVHCATVRNAARRRPDRDGRVRVHRGRRVLLLADRQEPALLRFLEPDRGRHQHPADKPDAGDESKAGIFGFVSDCRRCCGIKPTKIAV
jgi:hypothetical protein